MVFTLIEYQYLYHSLQTTGMPGMRNMCHPVCSSHYKRTIQRILTRVFLIDSGIQQEGFYVYNMYMMEEMVPTTVRQVSPKCQILPIESIF
jgi:hypothetical protein